MKVQDVAAILRSHLEGTEFDVTQDYQLGSPHTMRSKAARICGSTTQEGAVYQLRSWLPREIGCIVWRSLAAPCSSVLTPWYLGMSAMPDRFFKPGDIEDEWDINKHFDYPSERFEFDPDFAFDVFNALENLVDLHYKRAIEMVRSEWDPFESQQFEMQGFIEKTALELYEKNKQLAKNFLTDYSLSRANLALDKAQKIVNKLKTLFWRY
jgi:dipeptidase